MKTHLYVLLFVFTSMPSFAVEIYFGKKREKSFACKLAQSFKKSYPAKSLRKLKRETLSILRKEIKPYVNAHPIPAGFSLPKIVETVTLIPGFPASRSEYWIQNAFILHANPTLELKEHTENYFASFLHLARKRHVAYLNGEEPKFKLREEKNLLQQIEDHLPNVANYTFPHLDGNGNSIQQNGPVKKEKNRFTLAIGKTDHKMYDEFVYESQRYNEFASPLFVWLLKQDDFSVSPEELFEKSLEIYGNPLVAFGVIPWIFSGDALTVNRGTSSVVSYKMERLLEGNDIPGFQYHFWGYLIQSMMGNRFRVGSLAYVYEKLYQKDYPDWEVDKIALRLGKEFRKAFKKPERCQ
ncbi:MAG: hypothetical protein NXH75_05095 [Halobacteriovoraceae bacterium]|nr:hypothetical protein [Halobacteriovoraceae bacterium]